jgi:hypothetical protein
MAYTFLKAEGFTVGKSLVENEMLDTARQIKSRCEQSQVDLLLPDGSSGSRQLRADYAGKVAAKTIPVEFTNRWSRRNGYRRGNDQSFRPGDERRQDDYLERADGCI